MNDINAIIAIICQSHDAKDEQDLEEICAATAAFSLGVLRGIRGDDYVDGFLSAAGKDKTNLTNNAGVCL